MANSLSVSTNTRKLMSLSVGLVIALLILIAGCEAHGDSPPRPTPPSVGKLPIYPGAENVREQFQGSDESVSSRLITFEISDEPYKVLEYYKSLLEKDGWLRAQADDESPDTLHYVWSNGFIHGVYLSAKKTSSNRTNVEIALSRSTRP